MRLGEPPEAATCCQEATDNGTLQERAAAARVVAERKLKAALAARKNRKRAAKPDPSESTRLRRTGFVALPAVIQQSLIDGTVGLFDSWEEEARVEYVVEGCLVSKEEEWTAMAQALAALSVRIHAVAEKEHRSNLKIQNAFAMVCFRDHSNDIINEAIGASSACAAIVQLGGLSQEITFRSTLHGTTESDGPTSNILLSAGGCLLVQATTPRPTIECPSIEQTALFIVSFELTDSTKDRNQLMLSQLAPSLPPRLSTQLHEWECVVPDAVFKGSPIRLLRAPCYFQLQLQCPTGAKVWQNGLVVARWLEQHAQHLLQGKAVLELGAGFHGLLGLVASRLGAEQVVLTDSEKVAVDCLVVNSRLEILAHPSAQIAACKLDWAWQDSTKSDCDSVCVHAPDWVLVSDPLVWPELAPILLRTLERLLIRSEYSEAVRPVACVGWENRESRQEAEDLFLKLLANSQLTMQNVQLEGEESNQRLILLRAR